MTSKARYILAIVLLGMSSLSSASSSGALVSDYPTGTIAEIKATVTALRFFVSPDPMKRKQYDDLFFYNAAKYIYWELSLLYPAPGRRMSVAIEDVWYYPGGAFAYRGTNTLTIEPEWVSSQFFSGARLVNTIRVPIDNPIYYDCTQRKLEVERQQGWSSIECSPTTDGVVSHWPQGTYQVDIFVNKKKVATGWFTVSHKEAIYAEVESKARDRSTPTGRIDILRANVRGLRFFEMGATFPERSQRRFVTRFSQTARQIGWQLDLEHAATGRAGPLPIEGLLYVSDSAGDRVVQRKVLDAVVPGDWADTFYTDAFGWDDDYYWQRAGNGRSPAKWLPGRYRLDLYVLDRKIATASFGIEN